MIEWIVPSVSLWVLGDIFLEFLMLSLLATGGVLSLAPAMHQYFVVEMALLTDAQFTTAFAIAQSAPGPNILIVTVLGWQVAGVWGAMATTVGVALPSAVLALTVFRISHRRANLAWVRAIREGLAPVVIGLMLATAWILSETWFGDIKILALVVITGLISGFTRVTPVALIAAGALIGGLGLLR